MSRSSEIYHRLEHDKYMSSFYYSVAIGTLIAASSPMRHSNTTTAQKEDPDMTPTPFKHNVQLQPLECG